MWPYLYLAIASPSCAAMLWFGIWRPVLRGTFDRQDGCPVHGDTTACSCQLATVTWASLPVEEV
jgi:hypothetical protein